MATELSEESSYLRSLLSIHKIIVIINQSKRASERAETPSTNLRDAGAAELTL
jgi:hypothetical protein